MAGMIAPSVETTILDFCTSDERSLMSHAIRGRAFDFTDDEMNRTAIACTFGGRVFMTEDFADFEQYDSLSGNLARLHRTLFHDDGFAVRPAVADALENAHMPCGDSTPRLHIHINEVTPTSRKRRNVGYEILIATSLLRKYAGTRTLFTVTNCADLSDAGFINLGGGIQAAYVDGD